MKDKKLDDSYLQSLKLRQRVSLLNSIAKLENTICKVTNSEPYFDELHDYFESEIDGYAVDQIEKINDVETLQLLTQALVSATYRPSNCQEFFDRLSSRYLAL